MKKKNKVKELKKDIRKELKKIISEKLQVAPRKITLETKFEDLGADSLDMVDLIMEIEDNYDIRIYDEEIQQMEKVRDVVDYLTRRIQETSNHYNP